MVSSQHMPAKAPTGLHPSVSVRLTASLGTQDLLPMLLLTGNLQLHTTWQHQLYAQNH